MCCGCCHSLHGFNADQVRLAHESRPGALSLCLLLHACPSLAFAVCVHGTVSVCVSCKTVVEEKGTHPELDVEVGDKQFAGSAALLSSHGIQLCLGLGLLLCSLPCQVLFSLHTTQHCGVLLARLASQFT